MELNDFRQLNTGEGKAALHAAEQLNPKEIDFLSHYQQLSKQFQPELARAALGAAILRIEAQRKFPQADKLFFTREALEQASHPQVSAWRATRYAGFSKVFDFACSVGTDSLALGKVTSAIGVDRDPLRLAMAQANAAALNVDAHFLQADLANLPLLLPNNSQTAIFFDPARRSEHQRVFDVEKYQPPLSIIEKWLPQVPAIGVKLSPGVDLNQLERYAAEIEFVSFKGELKEAILWFGPLKTTHRRASLLPEGLSLYADNPPPHLETGPPGQYIYEPDAAILRAGLVATVAEQVQAHLIGPEVAYLTGETLVHTPLARVWKIEDWMPFNLKKLRRYLRERNIGQLTVKKRRSPILPEDLIKALKPQGSASASLFLTKFKEKPIVIVTGSSSLDN